MATLIHKAILGLSLLVAANVTLAAPITLTGDHFSVSYDSDLTALYGAGALSGSLDTVYFQPNTFSALSGGSPANTQVLLQLSFTIDPGYTFAGLSFTERGDYLILGGGAVDVAAEILLVNADTAASATLSLAPGTPLEQTDDLLAWQLSGSLAALGLGMPQTLQLTLDNELFANAPAGDLGFIQKTYVGFRVLTAAQPAVVPEPSSVALVFAGILAALLVGRRRLGVPVRTHVRQNA